MNNRRFCFLKSVLIVSVLFCCCTFLSASTPDSTYLKALDQLLCSGYCSNDNSFRHQLKLVSITYGSFQKLGKNHPVSSLPSDIRLELINKLVSVYAETQMRQDQLEIIASYYRKSVSEEQLKELNGLLATTKGEQLCSHLRVARAKIQVRTVPFMLASLSALGGVENMKKKLNEPLDDIEKGECSAGYQAAFDTYYHEMRIGEEVLQMLTVVSQLFQQSVLEQEPNEMMEIFEAYERKMQKFLKRNIKNIVLNSYMDVVTEEDLLFLRKLGSLSSHEAISRAGMEMLKDAINSGTQYLKRYGAWLERNLDPFLSELTLHSSDLKLYELQGDVKSCRVTSSRCWMENGEWILRKEGQISAFWTYSKYGRLLSCDDLVFETDEYGEQKLETDVYQLKRDEEGRLTSIFLKESRQQLLYEYNKDGRLSVSDYLVPDGKKRHTTYEYNEQGRLISSISSIGESQREKTFEYLKHDSQGNWTERLLCTDDGISVMEKRQIIYWSDKAIDWNDGITVKFVPVQVVEEEPVEMTIYEVVEHMPDFPGGEAALQKYLKKHVVYPESARKKGVQGRVLVQFVVGKDGSICDTKVVRSVEPVLDREAVRVINKMPKWKPGRQKGKPVRVRYTVPINFRL